MRRSVGLGGIAEYREIELMFRVHIVIQLERIVLRIEAPMSLIAIRSASALNLRLPERSRAASLGLNDPKKKSLSSAPVPVPEVDAIVVILFGQHFADLVESHVITLKPRLSNALGRIDAYALP